MGLMLSVQSRGGGEMPPIHGSRAPVSGDDHERKTERMREQRQTGRTETGAREEAAEFDETAGRKARFRNAGAGIERRRSALYGYI
jgi:hypothetical protein